MRGRLMRWAWLAALLAPAAAWGQGIGPAGNFCPATGCVFGNITATGTLGVTGNTTLGNTAITNITGTSATNALVFKNGPAGAVMMSVGGTAANVLLSTNIQLPGGAWGAGALVNGVAPIFQNAAFTGSNTNVAGALGAFLQQTDNSSNTALGVGFLEHLSLIGSGEVGGRTAGQFNLDINATTGNANGQIYVGLGSKCNLMATDGGSVVNSACQGANFVTHAGAGVTAESITGLEVNTWLEAGAIVKHRIGLQIVDVTGSTFGTQGTIDDVALSLNNQYAPSASLGFLVGLSFGRRDGNFPIATNGTLISGQANAGGGFTVANGIDWSLGTFTGNTWNDGHVTISGAGIVTAAAYKVGATAGVTCASVTAASVTVANGIVTHC